MALAYAHVYLKFHGSLHELAKYLRNKLNISEKNNANPSHEQYRYGLNKGGGEYYSFLFFGLELNVIVNQGEVFEEEYGGFNYYLSIEQLEEISDNKTFSYVILFLVELLKSDGLTIEFELM